MHLTIAKLQERVSIVDVARHFFPRSLKRVGQDEYDISPCPVCGHREHLRIDARSNAYNSFAGCVEGGGVYKFLLNVVGLSEKEAYETLLEFANAKSERRKLMHEASVSFISTDLNAYKWLELSPSEEEIEEIKKLTNFSRETIERFKLHIGFDKKNIKRLFFPYMKDGEIVGYSARSIGDYEPKYVKSKGFNGFYNVDNMLESDIVFVCEGEKDALSFEDIGYHAIALGGASNVKRFLEEVENKKYNIVFAFALDNDEAGQEAKKTALGYLTRAQTNIVFFEFPEDYKDVHEYFIKERENFEADVVKFIASVFRDEKEQILKDSIARYLEIDFLQDFAEEEDVIARTGFETLDEMLKLQRGRLFVIGGIPSVGKTTFSVQLALQIAVQGIHVIYFSLEQSRYELTNKILRMMYAKKYASIEELKEDALNEKKFKEKIPSLINELKNFGEFLHIVEADFEFDFESIRKYVRRMKRVLKDEDLVVFIDYLQVVREEKFDNLREKVEQIVKKLKCMARDEKILVIAISSFNRQNYTNTFFNSFKESGIIEYTADVLIGLELDVDRREGIETNNGKKAKDSLIVAGLQENPRKINLVCLKNRAGSPFVLPFNYYPAADYFVEA